MSCRAVGVVVGCVVAAVGCTDHGQDALVDAADLDGSVIDAVDSIDAPPDAAPIDAIELDATPIDLGAWPAPVAVAVVYGADGTPRGDGVGATTLAFAVEQEARPGWQKLGLYIGGGGGLASEQFGVGFWSDAAFVPTTRGTFIVYRAIATMEVPGATRLPPDCDTPLVGERGGGVICTRPPQVPPTWPPPPLNANCCLVRITPALAVDPGFGVDGRLDPPASVGVFPLTHGGADYLVQGTPTSSLVTLRGSRGLFRFDGVTGAVDAGFGAAGVVPLGFPTAQFMAMAPLADAGVALVERVAGGLMLHRISATGVRAPPQFIALAATPLRVVADDAGHLTIWFGFDDAAQGRLLRLDDATGLLDPAFGTGGRVAFTVPLCVEPELCGGWTWTFTGGLGAGPIVVRGVRAPTGPPWDASVRYALVPE